MKYLFVLCLILSQSAAAQSFKVEVKSQSLCPVCSIQAQQILHAFMTPQNQPASVLFINNNVASMEESETTAAAILLSGMSTRSALASQLIQKSREHRTLFRLYYQFGLSLEGKTSLYNSLGLPTYEVDRRHPHELWGFYQIQNGQSAVLLNEYQHPWNAWSTIVHELFHLYDSKTSQLIEQRRQAQQSWSLLDDLAIEFRSHLAEVLFRRELKQSDFFKNEPLLKEDYKDRFLVRNNLDLEALANHTYDLFYPKTANSPSLQIDEQAQLKAMDLSYKPFLQKFWEKTVPREILAAGVIETALWFFEQTLSPQKSHTQPSFSAFVLQYRSQPASEVLTDSLQKRKIIDSLIAESGSKNFFDYLKKIGFADEEELKQGFKLGSTLNQIPGKSGGTSPRVNGGG